jgi:hypothetical protein
LLLACLTVFDVLLIQRKALQTTLSDSRLRFSAGIPEDIAVLELAVEVPKPAHPAPLIALEQAQYTNLDVLCFGFPNRIDEGVPRTGTCRGENALGRVHLEVDRGLIEGGFSGTGAWDLARGAVVGIVVAARIEDQSAQLIPVRTLFAACPELDRDWRPRNPYKGLAAFEPGDSADFFGRTAVIAHLTERVGQQRLTTLIGPSGSGKSSLIGAGLVPSLTERGGWRILRNRPGADPLDALAGGLIPEGLTPSQRVAERRRLIDLLFDAPRGALDLFREWLAAQPDTRLLLIVDQFEELFTNAQPNHPQRAADFVKVLAALSAAQYPVQLPIHRVLALRADFMGAAMDGLTAPFVAPERQFQVNPLDGDDLRAAIEAPAAAQGVRFAPGVTQAMLAELEDQPGRLPLLPIAVADERRGV